MTLTCGGTMSGNCATGSAVSAITPAIVMTVETTNASRGRRMKTDEIVMALLLLRPAVAAARLGVDGHARPHALLALDDDPLAGLQIPR